MKALITTISLIAILALLAFTNPGPNSYADYIRGKMLKQSDQTSDLGRAAAGLFGSVAGQVIADSARRHNYVFFSLYEGTLQKSHSTVLGIFDNFFRLSGHSSQTSTHS